MPAAWVLPVAAAGFGGGVLLAPRLIVPDLALLVLGAALLACGAALGTPGSAAASRPDPVGPGDPRERLLAAAGIRSTAPAPPRPGALAALAAGFLLLGAGWGGLRSSPVPGVAALEGRFVRFEGTAATDLREFAFGWGLEARLELVDAGEDGAWTSLRLWLRGRGDPPAVEPGHPIAGAGAFRVIERGESGFLDHLLDRGVAGIVSVRGDLERLGEERSAPLRWANAARRGLRRGAERALPAREAGLLLGLTVGDVSTLDPEVAEDFRATGLGHLLAVSGSNVAMFLAPILALTMLFRARPRVRFLVGVLAVALFALITRWEPSVLRASVMAGLALLGVLAGRPRSTASLLGGAVLLLLVVDPALVRALAFQLSVAATAGIVALAGPLADRLRFLPRWMALALSATVGAQAAVTPLLLISFGVVPLVTIVANVLAYPLVPLALFAGLLASGVALVSEPLGAALGSLGRLPIAYLAELADRTARAPLPAVTADGLGLPLIAGVLFLLAAWRLRSGLPPRRASVVMLLVLALVWGGAAGARPPDVLTVTFFDIGQGDAALVRTPEDVSVLIDAGPEPDRVAVKLASLGIRRLDLVIASHAHADHIEGFRAVLSRHPVGLFLEPGCEAESPSYHRLLDALDDEGVRVHHARGGERLRLGELVVEVLGPDECGVTGPNDDSVVVRLRYGDAAVLFPGDAEHAAQRDLLDDEDPVTATVLKVPHHGGNTSVEGFFEAVGAAVAVVSTGPNTYGHPVPEVLVALESLGARVFRTDLEGDLTVRFAPEGVLVESGGG